jgi:WS/DGAT/MGAT family acyltransferase
MTVGALVVLDRPLDRDALAERLVATSRREPQLRQRPDDPTFSRVRPSWVQDDEIDVDHHLRAVAIAAPGSMRQVLDVVALLEPVPFDAERPPWDMTVINGVEGGRAAVYARAHHVLSDGLSGLRLMRAIFDESDEPSVRTERSPRVTRTAAPDETDEDDRRRGVVVIDLTRAAAPIRRRIDAAREREAVHAVVGTFQRALDLANSVSRQVMVTGGPLSPLFDDRAMSSRFEILTVTGVRETARAYGGSRNDLFVAAAARALGLYHEAMQRPSHKLRLATPAGVPHAYEGGNWFAPARVEIPTDIPHPGRLFGMVAERLAQARAEPALRLTAALATAIGRLPTRLLLPALHAQADSVDFAATTLPGLHGPRHICGAAIEAVYPFGPRLGCPVNLTALGNEDRLDIGLAIDPSAITAPGTFRHDLVEAFDDFDTKRTANASLHVVDAPTS